MRRTSLIIAIAFTFVCISACNKTKEVQNAQEIDSLSESKTEEKVEAKSESKTEEKVDDPDVKGNKKDSNLNSDSGEKQNTESDKN